MVKYTNTYEVLPNIILTTLDRENLSPKVKAHALGICADVLYSKQVPDAEGKVAIPKTYFSKRYGGSYHRAMKVLVDKGIVIRNDSYSTEHHYCKTYQINNTFLSGRMKSFSYETRCKEGTSDEVTQKTYELLKGISFNGGAALNDLKKYIRSNEFLKDVKVNENISEDRFFLYVSKKDVKYKGIYVTKEQALDLALKSGKDIVQDKNKFYLIKYETFKTNKVNKVYKAHYRTIKKLEKNIIYAKRNETNKRLDTPITNLPNRYLKYIKIKGKDLINIDIKNSQMAILANLLKTNKLHNVRQPDVDLFYKLASTGTLYEYLQKSFGLDSRFEAKLSCFQVLFSHYRYRSNRVNVFKEAFPSVYAAIVAFKKKYGSNQLAIYLQSYESELMIDGVLKSCLDKGMFALSKHDSILVPEGEEHKALKHLTTVFNSYGFECKVYVE